MPLTDNFDPNARGIKGSLFGLPFCLEDANLVLVPVPWEATVSYHTGTASGPEAMLEASSQVDLLVTDIPDAWKMGIHMLGISVTSKRLFRKLKFIKRSHMVRCLYWMAS